MLTAGFSEAASNFMNGKRILDKACPREYQELLINEVLDPMFQIVAVVRVMTNSAGMKLTPRVVPSW
ncbi:UNVERIFIED_CONTAM: hypothetical protein Sangu_3174000 [Sesamum angustifolium]|uniref:Uncharacterized protein n=2 Tax=Sesamum TaxID=4181 RepID=A0AAW2SIC2_9LAMI